MLNPNPARSVVLIACGLLAFGGLIGLWPANNSPVAPTATAAPVPAIDKSAELETAWDGLAADPKTQTRATVRLAADPKATVAFLKKKLPPVSADEKSAKKALADIESDDEKTWQAAYRWIQHNDPRLVMSVPDVWAEVKSDLGRHRLYHAVMTDGPPDHPAIVRETWYTYDDPKPSGDRLIGKWYDVVVHPTADAPKTARVNFTQSVPGEAINFHRQEWERADRGITLLEVFATPDAVDLLKDIAGGHPDARPTQSAKEALGRLKIK